MIKRLVSHKIESALHRGKSVLLLGPRQVGKTTLLNTVRVDLSLNLSIIKLRQALEKNPAQLAQEIGALNSPRPLILIDEIQKVPELLDEIQVLIDEKRAQFILTGSSARKLKRSNAPNLLPGRVVALRLDGFSYGEYPSLPLEQMLVDGQLPEIALNLNATERSEDLHSYVSTYLEDEVRQEALVRNVGMFNRFLEMAALESGRILNFASISNELGPSIPTVTSYYQILFDCLIAERIDPVIESHTRKRLTKTPRALFFDLGVRRIAAGEGRRLGPRRYGELLEHWVGNEILKWIHAGHPEAKLRFWREPEGPEVDWVVELEGRYFPIEIKWSENISGSDIRHLETFIAEYPQAKRGIIISRISGRRKISDRVEAVPWSELETDLEKFRLE